MQIFRNFQGRQVRFTNERLDHILESHEDMEPLIFAIRETLELPDAVIQSNTNRNAHLSGMLISITGNIPKPMLATNIYVLWL